MRKLLLCALVAVAVSIGVQGTGFAATPGVSTAAVRQAVIFVDSPIADSADLSNQPDITDDDSNNE